MLPSDNANNADANGIYRFTPTTNFGTSGIVNQGYGVIICWGTESIWTRWYLVLATLLFYQQFHRGLSNTNKYRSMSLHGLRFKRV